MSPLLLLLNRWGWNSFLFFLLFFLSFSFLTFAFSTRDCYNNLYNLFSKWLLVDFEALTGDHPESNRAVMQLDGGKLETPTPEMPQYVRFYTSGYLLIMHTIDLLFFQLFSILGMSPFRYSCIPFLSVLDSGEGH